MLACQEVSLSTSHQPAGTPCSKISVTVSCLGFNSLEQDRSIICSNAVVTPVSFAPLIGAKCRWHVSRLRMNVLCGGQTTSDTRTTRRRYSYGLMYGGIHFV